MTASKRVQLLYFADCPNHEGARELVERIAAEEEVPVEIELVEVKTLEEAKQQRPMDDPTAQQQEPTASPHSSAPLSPRDLDNAGASAR